MRRERSSPNPEKMLSKVSPEWELGVDVVLLCTVTSSLRIICPGERAELQERPGWISGLNLNQEKEDLAKRY